MNLIGLGFWISVILGVLEFFKVISIGWLLVLAPFAAAVGIWLALFIIGLVIGLIGLIIVAIAGK